MPTPQPCKKKVLIVDDHPLVCAGLARIINQQDDMEVCGDAQTAPTGMAAVAKSNPDAAIVDLSLNVGSGLDLIKDIHVLYPRLPILVVSVQHENLYAERAIHAGAKGYVMKSQPIGAVLDGLRRILEGRMAVSEEIVHQLITHRTVGREATTHSSIDALSDRELEVFRLLGQGQSSRRIAEQIGVAVSTVESYRASIKQKFGLINGSELVARAARFVAEKTWA